MALAMVQGLIEAGHPAGHVAVADPSGQRRALAAQLGNIATHEDNAAAVAGADVVVLAVKPHLVEPVCRLLAGAVRQDAPLVVSIAAGVTIGSIRDYLGGHRRIVRVMPNTPALVRRGVAGLFASADIGQGDRDTVTGIIESVGRALWVASEDALHDVTAISGSGPAYFFRFLECLEAEAVALGFDTDSAAMLVRETAAGAARMALAADVPLAELRRRVTSPGGTTAAALAVLEDGDLAALIHRAITAARERSVELARPSDES